MDNSKSVVNSDNDANIVLNMCERPIQVNKRNKSSNEGKKNSGKKEHIETDIQTSSKQNQSSMKRGQRGKLKKIKEKYKDQDEDDREKSMTALQVCTLICFY